MSELLLEMPAVALRGVTILPGMVTHFDVSRPKSVKAVETAMLVDSKIFLVTQRDMDDEEPAVEDLYHIGVVAEIKQLLKLQDNIIRVIVEGKERAELAYFLEEKSYLRAQIVLFEKEETNEPAETEDAMLRSLQEALLDYCTANPKAGKELRKQIEGLNQLDSFLDIVSSGLPLSYQNRQRLLEAVKRKERYEVLMEILLRETDINKIKNELQRKVKENVDKNQREYILREEMKVIREELGEDHTSSDIQQFEERLEKLKADKPVKERIRKEIERFKNVAANPSEGSVSRGYIETLLDLPWNKKSKDNTDLKNAKRILDEDHYGLEKVKDRMLEFLAVRNLTKKGDSPIICLVGPPGTGKTSIARSVAKALEKICADLPRRCAG